MPSRRGMGLREAPVVPSCPPLQRSRAVSVAGGGLAALPVLRTGHFRDRKWGREPKGRQSMEALRRVRACTILGPPRQSRC